MGIGFFEICIIALAALVFFGPQRLPEMMKEVGKFFVHVKRLSSEVKGHFETVMNEAETSIIAEEEKKRAQAKAFASTPTNPPPTNVQATTPESGQTPSS